MRGASDFWSRRRAAVEAEERAEARAVAQVRDEEAARALEERPDEVILAELNLPDPDTLQPGDDFSAFLAKAVPQRIQRRALRRLWLSNPLLANLDELVEYGEDYTDAARVVENLQTTYQVGKGMMKHLEALAEQAEAKARAEAAPQEAAEDPGEEIEEAPAPLAFAEDTGDPAEPREVAEADAPLQIAPEGPPARRRMRFTFTQDAGGASA